MIALALLLLVSYFIISGNFQKLMTEYTFQLMQSMVDQGVTTVEYELQVGRAEADSYAESISSRICAGSEIAFPNKFSRSDVLRMVYVSSDSVSVSDGRKRDIKERDDVKAAFAGTGSIYGPYFNEENEYIVCYSAPVYQNGNIVGVLSIEKDGYIFSSIIQGLQFVDSGESYLINAEGTDIAVSRQEHMEWVDSRYNAQKILAEKEDPVTRSIMELERNGLDGKNGRGTYYWEDGLCYLFYAPVPSTGWVLLTGLRQEEIHSMTQSMLYASISKGPLLGVCITAFLLLTASIIIWIILSLKKSSKENERLEIRANRDPLTGIRNRNCFYSDVEMLKTGIYQSFACVYMDANGLHEINNHMGHAAGDQMLKDLAEILWQVFGPEYVYRIGGDEFVAFCMNQDKQEVYRKVELVKKNLKKQEYIVSVGIEWRDDTIDMEAMINRAEQMMQENKKEFYKANGRERQLRILNQELEQILLEKQDADTFLSVLAPGFNGVYFVNLSSDTIRHLFIPSYFQELLEETNDKFSEALHLYAGRIVRAEYRQQFETFCDYGYLETLLNQEKKPVFIYQKQDETWIKLQILKFKAFSPENKETLWIFEDMGTDQNCCDAGR